MRYRRLSAVIAALTAGLAVVVPRPATAAPTGHPTREQAVRDARDAVRRHGPAVHAAAAGEEYQVRGVVIDPDGSRHVRFDRTYRGLPVLGGDYVLHANPDGSFRDATAAQGAAIDVGIRPAIGEAAAIAAARRRSAGKWAGASARLVVDAAEGTPALAWAVVLTGDERELHVVVDARSGVVRGVDDGAVAADAGTGHSLYSGNVPLNAIRRAQGDFTLTDPDRGNAQTLDAQNSDDPTPTGSIPLVDADNVWGSGALDDRATVAADVHYGVAQAYDFFKREFGRNGVRDDGTAPVAMVHQLDANAVYYMYCYCMSFGDGNATVGPFVSQDVVAHEWSHGVTFSTAGLLTSGESGGLNEATSDIFGTLVEFAAGNPNDPPDYLIGEKLNNGGPGLPLRYLDEPSRNGSGDSCWSAAIAEHDPHDSSGVAGKFFYQLAVGSGASAWGNSPTCNGAPAVTGIGNDKAGRIWYRAVTVYMVTNSNYVSARQATLNAAADLYGAGGPEYAAVDAAWKAVNVDGSGPLAQEPAVWNPGNLESDVGQSVRVQLKATDPQGDKITFSAVGLPEGLSISADGVISGTTPSPGYSFVQVSVTDSGGHTAMVRFDWDVWGWPVVTNPGDQSGKVGEDGFVSIFATDHDHQLTYTFTGLPDGVQVLNSYAFGTLTKAGTYHVTATVTNAKKRSTSVSFVWTVTD